MDELELRFEAIAERESAALPLDPRRGRDPEVFRSSAPLSGLRQRRHPV